MEYWKSPIQGGEVRFTKFLGEGMNAQVFACVVTRDGKSSAMAAKIPHDPSDPDFGNEARVLVGRVIRNSVHMELPQPVNNQFGAASKMILMDEVNGRSLDHLAKAGLRIAPDQVAAILGQGAAALSDAHASGIAHRDLKPENLMFNPKTQKLTVIDWGESTPVDSSEPRGHYDYRPPEWKSANARGDAHDVYALATICTELLTGRRDPAMLRRLTGKARQLVPLLAHAAQRDPNLRSTADQLLEQIDGIPSLGKPIRKAPSRSGPSF